MRIEIIRVRNVFVFSFVNLTVVFFGALSVQLA